MSVTSIFGYKFRFIMSILTPMLLFSGLLFTVHNNYPLVFFFAGATALLSASTYMFSRCPKCGRQTMKRVYKPGKFQISNWYMLYPKKCAECGHNYSQQTKSMS